MAEFSIQHFENEFLENAPCRPLFWKRYVDDIITALPNDQINNFLQFLNSQNEDFQFTHEVEINNTFAYLDLLIKRLDNGTLKFSVYRKPTNTDRYLDAGSYHPTSHKRSTAVTLFKRAANLCSDENVNTEVHNVKKILKTNGYNNNIISSSLTRRNTPGVGDSQANNENFKYVSVPYIKGASERVDKILQRYGYKLGHHLTHTLESKLSKLKDMRPDSDKCGVIYKIKCNECNHVYIGETGKELYKRVSEHKLAVRRGDNLSAIYHHISETGHSMNWDHTEVLAQQNTAEKRRILESMYSNNNNNALNRSSKLPNAYSSIVNQIVRHN